MTKTKTRKLILGTCSILFFLSFYLNTFHIAGQDTFDKFQKDSESLVVGRLIMSQQAGLFSEGGLTGSIDISVNRGNYIYIYDFYKNNSKIKKNSFKPYFSQNGGQAIIFSLLTKLSSLSNKNNLEILWILSSLILSIVFVYLILWVKKQFGLTTAMIAFILILFSKWITVFGRNLWWVLWSFYFPFVFLLHFLENRLNKNKPLYLLFFISYFLVLFKCFFTGFEYITTFLIMLTIPFVFYAVLEKSDIKTFIKKMVIILSASIFSILTSFILLAYQISFVKGSIINGFEHILFSFKKRSYGDSSLLPNMYKESLDSNVIDVVNIYLNTSVVGPITFLNVIIFFLFVSAMLYLINKKTNRLNRKCFALIVSLWVSITAPLSWFVIFKAHSFIHKDMNIIVWYMPFFLLGFISIGYLISELKKTYNPKTFKKITKTPYKSNLMP